MESNLETSVEAIETNRIAPPSPALWLFHLYFQPRRFFAYFPQLVSAFSAAYAALIVGTAEIIGRISEELTKTEFGMRKRVPDLVVESWQGYWLFCIGLGLVGALLYYRIGGWWYHLRLRWAGSAAPDRRLARQVFIFASLVVALPTVLMTILDSFRFPTPIAAERGMQWWWFLAIVLPYWSVYTSYRGVRTLFATKLGRCRLWFLILPAAFYIVLTGSLFVIAGLAAFGVVSVPPDVTHPETINRPGFSLKYPGNWWVVEDAEDYDPDHDITIEPIQDALVVIRVSDDAVVPEEELASRLEAYRQLLTFAQPSRFTNWGAFVGAGAEFRGELDGDRYLVRIFTTSTATRGFTIIEQSAESVAREVEPGFTLIRSSFLLID